MSNAGSPPCCCMTLELGSRLAGFFQVIWSILVGIVITIAIVHGGNVLQARGLTYGAGAYAIFAILYILYLTKLISGTILIVASFQRHLGALNIWFYATLILIFLEVFLIIYSLTVRGVPWHILIGIALDLYFVWVGRAFTHELKNPLPAIHV